MARARRLSANRMLVELIENGIEAPSVFGPLPIRLK